MSYVKNLSRFAAVVLAVSFMSCITYQEPVWTYPSVKWSKDRLPLIVSSHKLDGYIPDIKAAINVWNKAAGCELMAYKEDVTNPHIQIIRDPISHPYHWDTVSAISFSKYTDNGAMVATIHVYKPYAGDWPYLVFAHSLGRALGLAHDPYHRTSIMYGYTNDYTLYSRVRDVDRRALRERYCR